MREIVAIARSYEKMLQNLHVRSSRIRAPVISGPKRHRFDCAKGSLFALEGSWRLTNAREWLCEWKL